MDDEMDDEKLEAIVDAAAKELADAASSAAHCHASALCGEKAFYIQILEHVALMSLVAATRQKLEENLKKFFHNGPDKAEYLLRFGMSQTEIADMLGVSPPTVRKYLGKI